MDMEAVSARLSLDLPAWQRATSAGAAFLLMLIFVSSGVWKITDPFTWSEALGQFRIPSSLSLPFTLALGILETVSGVLILVPRFRRWGSLLVCVLVAAFMVYIGANYTALAGKDCSCFPIVKRTVGPGFFIGDGLMLVLAILAGRWARPSSNLKVALMVLGAVTVFAGVSYGVNVARLTGIKAPDSITVDGHRQSLQSGRIFLFFYDPACMHCDAAARRMAKLHWVDASVIAIPVNQPQWAAAFLHDTGLKAGTSLDEQPLRKVFHFLNTPYGVALVSGRQKADVSNFDESEPARTLRAVGFVE